VTRIVTVFGHMFTFKRFQLTHRIGNVHARHDGVVAFEYTPRFPPADALDRTGEVLRNMVRRTRWLWSGSQSGKFRSISECRFRVIQGHE